jgi:hypothetical protein
MQAISVPSNWGNGWNPHNRPIVLSSVLSPDGTYVTQFRRTSANILNPNALNGLNAPFRPGFFFRDWNTDQHGNSNGWLVANNVPINTTVHAIWTTNLSSGIGLAFRHIGTVQGIRQYAVQGRGNFSGQHLVIPTINNGGIVTAIDAQAFMRNTGLRSVVIPAGIRTIGSMAFEAASNLQNVVLPASLVSIGASAFANCTNLLSIIIPFSVTTVGSNAFGGCNRLTIYMERTNIEGLNFSSSWNFSNRPVVTGSVLSPDKAYVVWFQMLGSAHAVISPPFRVGHTFNGWATSRLNAKNNQVAFSANEIITAPIGTNLYAVWRKI